MPAYSLTILLCALIGLFLTSLSCREYLTSSSLYTYLICNLLTFNFLSPDLPGVFDTNPLQAMNGSLWTIKVEFMLYIIIPIIYWLLKDTINWYAYFLFISYLSSTRQRVII